MKSERRSASDCERLVVFGFTVVVLNDCLKRLRVGRPEPLDCPEGVGANVNSSLSSSSCGGKGGREIEIISKERPLGVGANSNAEGFGSTFFCFSNTSSGIGFNTFSLGK